MLTFGRPAFVRVLFNVALCFVAHCRQRKTELTDILHAFAIRDETFLKSMGRPDTFSSKKSAAEAITTYSLRDKFSWTISTAIEEKNLRNVYNSKTEDDDRAVKERPCGDGTFSLFPCKKTLRDFFVLSYQFNKY